MNRADIEIIEIRKHGEMAHEAAKWFHAKWGVPLEAYAESIAACLEGRAGVPQWYLPSRSERSLAVLGS